MSIYDLLIRANRDVKAGLPTVAVARLAVVIDSIVADAFQEDWTSELAIINNGQKHVVLATKQRGDYLWKSGLENRTGETGQQG